MIKNNKNYPRLLMIMAALLLIGVYVWPLWEIKLIAPQYPDGVRMFIYVNKIGGDSPGTLQNVNILNHYIGMKPIVPDAIPELKILPIIFAVFIALGILASWANKTWSYLAWVFLFAVFGIVGMYDFYLWEYDYGHTLDPNAPMQFEGTSFQPPLIGKKEILNFTAVSKPHIGGILSILSFFLAVAAFWFRKKYSQN